MKRRSFIASTSAMVAAPAVWAQSAWPKREIRMIHPFTAGDQTDVNARILAEGMAEYLKVPVIVENKPGAGGVLAMNFIGNARPDGYTIGYFTNGNVSLESIFQRYELLKLIDPICRYADSAQTIYAPHSKKYQSLKELLTAIQNKPGTLSLGIGGLGAPSHVMWELLASEFSPNLKVNLIPYKSATEATQAMLGGHLDAGVSFLTGVLPFVQNPGKIDVLAVSAKERIALVPQLPTMTEVLGKRFEFMNWTGICATKGTSAEQKQVLFAAVRHAVQTERFKKYCADYGSVINVSSSSETFVNEIKQALVAEKQLAKEKNIQLNGS